MQYVPLKCNGVEMENIMENTKVQVPKKLYLSKCTQSHSSTDLVLSIIKLLFMNIYLFLLHYRMRNLNSWRASGKILNIFKLRITFPTRQTITPRHLFRSCSPAFGSCHMIFISRFRSPSFPGVLDVKMFIFFLSTVRTSSPQAPNFILDFGSSRSSIT